MDAIDLGTCGKLSTGLQIGLVDIKCLLVLRQQLILVYVGSNDLGDSFNAFRTPLFGILAMVSCFEVIGDTLEDFGIKRM